jgi:hypothetical protein
MWKTVNFYKIVLLTFVIDNFILIFNLITIRLYAVEKSKIPRTPWDLPFYNKSYNNTQRIVDENL